MLHPVFTVTSVSGTADTPPRFGGSPRPTKHRLGWLSPMLMGCLLTAGALAASPTTSSPERKDEFGELIKLAPLVVKGDQLTISIHARTKRDRRYAEAFAEQTIRVVYESVTPETGKGLVIIGRKGEPHPIFVFRKFLALADGGKLDPAIAARAPELSAMLARWQDDVDVEQSSAKGDHREMDMDFDRIVAALPLPLEGIGAKLYPLAWAENFDDARVEARLRGLRADDLERRDLFAHFDWVFYLPPKGAFDRVLDEIIADALRDEDVGFFARTAVKGAMLVVKPKIRQAIEAVRRGMMFLTVVRARTAFTEDEVSALTGAYIEAQFFGPKSSGRSEHERAVAAVQNRIRLNEEKAKEAVAVSEQPSATSGDPQSAGRDVEKPL